MEGLANWVTRRSYLFQRRFVLVRGKRRAAKSRVNREVQARFRERLEVKFLWPTRLDEEAKRKNTTKSKVRAKVEHVPHPETCLRLRQGEIPGDCEEP